MARNKLTDLNDHLFAQLERLNDEELTEDQIRNEVQRAKAITGLASQVIKSAKVTVDAMRMVANGEYPIEELPQMLGIEHKNNPVR